MRTVGLIATGAAGLVALIGLLLGLRSAPDVRRYLRIRQM